MGKKLIFLDLDGTALTDDKKLPAGNRKAIDEAMAAGHKIVVTTGRPLASAKKQAERHGLAGPGSYIVAYNGGLIYDAEHEKTIFQQTIDLETVRKVFAEAARRGVHIQAYRGDKVLVDPQNDDAELQSYCSLIEIDYEVIPDIAELEDEPVKMHSSTLAMQPHGRDSAAAEPDPGLLALRDWINENYAEKLDAFLSAPVYLEIVSHGMNKGIAVHKMAELLGYPISDTIAIGDEANDIPMIREAGIGAAMCNGLADAKAAADYVTMADNNHDGVAEVLRKFVLKL
ncbi:MAG: HAD family phosphatase [Eubacterium sp.]|nr:HAD family phosphatase [Eubacterium sp.]